MNKDWSWRPDIHNNQPIPEIGIKRYCHIKRAGGKVHEVDPETGKSFCKAENGTSKPMIYLATFPKNKKPCHICPDLNDPNRPKSKVSRKDAGDFYTSYEWAELRYKAFLKYGQECVVCGSNKKVTVDHIKPIRKYPELMADIDNLQVMCRLCNRGKGHWDETDWR